MKKRLLFIVLLACVECGDPRNASTISACQDKCGSLSDTCVKNASATMPQTACIDAYARCAAACSGQFPVGKVE